MDQDLVARFVEAVVSQAASGFQSVRIETIKYQRPTFKVFVSIEGRQECLVLNECEVEDAIFDNGLVLKLEWQLLKAGAPIRND